MDLWNKTHLSPPHSFCEYLIDGEIKESLSNFVQTLTQAADIGGPNHPVWEETEVLQALQLRFASRTPCDKFFHIFKRVGHCVKKLATLNLPKLYLELAELFLSGLQSSTPKVMLPSRSHLEYVLIRTQGTSKLLCEALSYSSETFCYLLQRLSVGHLLENLLMACSVIARISIYFKSLLVEVCDTYKELKPWCEKLPSGTWKWEQELHLPDDLWLWLKCKEICFKEDHLSTNSVAFLNKIFENTSEQTSENINIHIQSFLEDSFINTNGDVERNDSDSEIKENRKKRKSDSDEDLGENRNKRKYVSDEDLGEVVPRGKDETSNSTEAMLKKVKNGDVNHHTMSLKEKKLEKRLLQLKSEILKAETFKRLRRIWADIMKGRNMNIKLKYLSLRSKATIRKLFKEQKQIRQIGKQLLRADQMKNVTIKEVSDIAETFANNLMLKINEPVFKEKKKVIIKLNSGILELKRTNTLKGIKKLRQVILENASNQKKFCRILKDFVMSKLQDIRLLKQEGDLKMARWCAAQTSDTMIHRYRLLNL